ncbi:MAG TPA: inorganic diphosphatase [Candidatus Saccharibacteria bacterium]|nr:inorganic diphosphatase [Candidatus Saccharibacteria bacterium]HRK94462.1 inorganic diphosphatase [Candidatus Saccharibacteria bacterium]
MADFNQVLTPGNVDEGIVNTVVEIPEGSQLKVEWDREHAAFMLDRVEPAIFAKPCNYGFIPQTLDEDGDELDTLIVCPEPLPTGVWLEAKIIGVMRFEDDGEVDDKIVVVPTDNRDDGDAINSLADIPQLVKKLEHHFTHYKDLKKPGSTIVKGWGDVGEAKAVVKECIERWNSK